MRLSKNDPLYYKQKFVALVEHARKNEVTISIRDNRVMFDDRSEFLGQIITTTAVGVELEKF